MIDFTGENRYFVRSRISEAKFRAIVKHFAADLTAGQTARLTGTSRPSIDKIFGAVRRRIAEFCDKESCFETGEVELDESHFGAGRVKGIRGRGAGGKTIVFDLKKRDGKVYTPKSSKTARKTRFSLS